MCRFNSFSPGQKAIHVGIYRGFMKTPGFRPSPCNTFKEPAGGGLWGILNEPEKSMYTYYLPYLLTPYAGGKDLP
jgi:hypothetical protein